MDKAALRTQLRARRNSLSAEQQYLASSRLLDQFLSSGLNRAEHVGIYLANDGEINPSQICKLLWSEKKKTFLPRIVAESLQFVTYDQESQFVENQYGVPEPENYKSIDPEELDLILMPLVGFDNLGNRLGMGGGFYDRALRNAEKPIKIGLAHELQKTDLLMPDSWDIPLNGVLTDENYYTY